MQPLIFYRVVTLKKGKMKPVDFRLRKNEKGLSLFAVNDYVSLSRIVNAVQDAGKRGELGVAKIGFHDFQTLGLKLIQSPGGTSVTEVNKVHYEARLPNWRRLLLRLQGIPIHDYFNDTLSQPLFQKAILIENWDEK